MSHRLLGTQVAAWYRFRVGRFECTVVSDGNLDSSDGGPMFPSVDRVELSQVRAEFCVPNHSSHSLSLNTLVVNTGEHLVLIDCGIGNLEPDFQPRAGWLLANLRAAGIDPTDIDFVLLTHVHADHSGGLVTARGGRSFPNARLVLDTADLPSAGQTHRDGPSSAAIEVLERLAATGIAPYLADRVDPTELPQLMSGVTGIASPGHTPGHCSYLIESDDDSLLIIGDVFHDYAIEPMHPEWAVAYDADPTLASAERARTLRRCSVDRQKVLGYHFPWPGLGWFSPGCDGFRFLPEPMILSLDGANRPHQEHISAS